MNPKWRETIRFVKNIFAIFESTKKQSLNQKLPEIFDVIEFTNNSW